jgi:hypothetical protein
MRLADICEIGRHAGSAPIGARVFATERRNHSKTGVYELPCVRDPVDMIIPTDKMRKAKKGFKFERFDVFSRIERSHSGRRILEGRKAREATRMGGLPFNSMLPDRSQPLRLKALQNRSNSSSTAVTQNWSAGPELTDISSLLLRFRTESPRGSRLVDSRFRAHQKARRGLGWSEMQPVGVLLSNDRWNGFPTRPISREAHPLQYGLGVSWDDCSSPQKIAGRGNEETAQ